MRAASVSCIYTGSLLNRSGSGNMLTLADPKQPPIVIMICTGLSYWRLRQTPVEMAWEPPVQSSAVLVMFLGHVLLGASFFTNNNHLLEIRTVSFHPKLDLI